MDELYTVGEVSKLLKVSESTVIRLFADAEGTQDWGSSENFKLRKKRRRLLRIPASTLAKITKGKTKC